MTRTCKHALVDDTITDEESGITVHSAPMRRDYNDVPGYQIFRRNGLVYPITA